MKCVLVAKKSVLNHKKSVLSHLVYVFHLFHVLRALYFLHVLQTYSMFCNPGLQNQSINALMQVSY